MRIGEEIENSFAVDRTAVYIVSNQRMYRFSADRAGRAHIDWMIAYRNSGLHKPSQVDAGSGATPTILPGGLVAITDNADPMDVVVYRVATRLARHQPRIVCQVPGSHASISIRAPTDAASCGPTARSGRPASRHAAMPARSGRLTAQEVGDRVEQAPRPAVRVHVHERPAPPVVDQQRGDLTPETGSPPLPMLTEVVAEPDAQRRGPHPRLEVPLLPIGLGEPIGVDDLERVPLAGGPLEQHSDRSVVVAGVGTIIDEDLRAVRRRDQNEMGHRSTVPSCAADGVSVAGYRQARSRQPRRGDSAPERELETAGTAAGLRVIRRWRMAWDRMTSASSAEFKPLPTSEWPDGSGAIDISAGWPTCRGARRGA
ncbi:MAG TPA: hypothetical protein VFN55_05140 [Solirubrobacteraceae bacterium]|nr:hypothetical protein [Solirubrobacteraceae bacterium]